MQPDEILAAVMQRPDEFRRGGQLTAEIEVLRVGPASIAVATAETVTKIIKAGVNPRGVQPPEEFALLQALHRPDSDLPFVIPKPIDYGQNFITMNRLAAPAGLAAVKANEEKIGTAIGAFAAHIWQNHKGAIHDDLALGNFTLQPDGKVGMLDIASVVPPRSGQPEEMFLTLLLVDANLCPYVATAFEQQTGTKIDLGIVKQMHDARLRPLLGDKTPAERAQILAVSDRNLIAWDDFKNPPPPPPRPLGLPAADSAVQATNE